MGAGWGNRTPDYSLENCRFTTKLIPHWYSFGAPRIELGPHAPKASILPLYYAP